MATNFFFNNFQNSGEQVLIEDLIIESIKIYGHDVFYIPRRLGSIDAIFNEDATRSYTTAIPIEMYIKNIEGFAGEGDFLSKFNIQIRDQITFSLARRVFADEIGAAKEYYSDLSQNRSRPQEGDLIFFPLNKKIFEIKFVEHEAIFYQLGALQMYDLKCELFEYSNEYFKTGIADIDALAANYSTSFDNFGFMTESGWLITDEDSYPLYLSYDINENDPLAQNDELETEADLFLDFTERDPFSDGVY